MGRENKEGRTHDDFYSLTTMSLLDWLTGPPDVKRLKAKRRVSGLVRALNYRKPSLRIRGKTIGTGAGIRASAAWALGEICDTKAAEPLIALLEDDRDEALVQHSVTWALGQLRYRRAVDYIIPLLTEADEGLRMVAAEALGKIGDTEGIKHVTSLLRDPSYTVRWYVAWVLGEAGNPCAVTPLLACFAEEPSKGWLPYENAEPETKNSVFKYVSSALGKIRDLDAVEPLIAHLKSDELGVRRGAARALGELRDKRAVEPLLPLLNDSRWSVRLATAEALGKIADTHAVAPLARVLNDENEEVRKAAEHAIRTLTGGGPRERKRQEAGVSPMIRHQTQLPKQRIGRVRGLPRLTIPGVRVLWCLGILCFWIAMYLFYYYVLRHW